MEGSTMSEFDHGVAEEDDLLHARQDGVPLWSESAQINAYDSNLGIAIYTHWGLLGGEIWEANFGVYLPNGEVFASRTFAPRVEGEPMSTGQATVGPIVSRESWLMKYDGVARRLLMSELAAAPLADGPIERLKLDVVGHASSPAYGQGAGAENKGAELLGSGGVHIEQSLRVVGSLTLFGQTVPFEGVGHRDHSCGPRSNGHIWRESWINGSFPSGRTFHMLEVFGVGKPRYFMGYVWSGKEILEVSNYVGPLLTGPLGEPRTFDAHFDSDGGHQVAHAEVLGSLALTVNPTQGMYMGAAEKGEVTTQGPIRWTWDGETGFGWAERVYNRGGWTDLLDQDDRSGSGLGGPVSPSYGRWIH